MIYGSATLFRNFCRSWNSSNIVKIHQQQERRKFLIHHGTRFTVVQVDCNGKPLSTSKFSRYHHKGDAPVDLERRLSAQFSRRILALSISSASTSLSLGDSKAESGWRCSDRAMLQVMAGISPPKRIQWSSILLAWLSRRFGPFTHWEIDRVWDKKCSVYGIQMKYIAVLL